MQRRDGLRSAVLAIASWAAALAPAVAQIPVAQEFQANTYTTGAQTVRAVAATPGGGFIAVWQSTGQDHDGYGIVAHRFNSFGQKTGVEFLVNHFTAGQQVNASVAVADDGRFVVVWSSSAQDGSGAGIFGRRFDSVGGALAVEFQVNAYTTSGQSKPKVAASGAGAFVVVWQDDSRDAFNYGVFGRRFDSSGVALGGDFQVNVYTTNSQTSPVVAVLESGAFVVAWQSTNQDGLYNGVFARRYDSTGAPQAAEFQVNQYTYYSQDGQAIAARPDGGFLVVWKSSEQDGHVDGIFARRFDGTGSPLAAEIQINAYTTGNQRAPAVAVQGDGAFVVAWQDYRGTATYSVFARGFTGAGLPSTTSEFQVNSRTAIFQSGAVAAGLGDTFVVAWTAGGDLDGDTNGVFARRFRAGVFDVDADGTVGALTDGLMVLRYHFGFRDAALIAGALGPGCTRCDPDAIETFIDSWPDYDLDGDGLRLPLTDGILLLRYLFGFRDAALVAGALDMDCLFCDGASVAARVERGL